MGSIIRVPNLVGPQKKAILDMLADKGEHICQVASAQRNTKPRTWNQQDAYGWGVYYNGECKRMGYATKTKNAKKKNRFGKNMYSGRKEIKEFLDKYHPSLAGFVLIVANAMPYSVLHEEGSMPKGQYRIVSQVAGMFDTAGKDVMSALNAKGTKYNVYHWTRQPGF